MTTITLYEPSQAHQALTECWKFIKASLIAGTRLELTIKPETRNTEQNAKLHALLTDISRDVVWHGQRFDKDTWKRLCTASWLRERGEKPLLIPALDGQGLDIIYEPTSKMDKREFGELIEWCEAFYAEQKGEK